MKIIKCYVSSFGNLKDVTFDFEQGLNVIKQDNGFGKTTLTIFIKAMFYGLSGKGKRKLEDNELLKYRPWNTTEKFGGYIEFSFKNSSFRLERFFGTKDSEETVRLFDLATGKESFDTENLGTRIFEIDEEGFLSTVFLSQKDMEITENSSITLKYNQTFEVESSSPSFDNAKAKLEEKLKSIKRTGSRGRYFELKDQIFECESELRKISNSERAIHELETEKQTLNTKREQLGAEYKTLAEKVNDCEVNNSVKNQISKKLTEDLAKCNEEKMVALTKLGGKIPSKNKIDAYYDCYNGYLEQSSKASALNTEILNLSSFAKNEKNAKKPMPLKAICLILSAIVLCAGVGLTFVSLVVGICLLVLGIAGCIVGITIKNNKTLPNTNENVLAERQLVLNECLENKKQYETALNTFKAEFGQEQNSNYVRAIEEIKSNLAVFETCELRCKSLMQEISSLPNGGASDQNVEQLFVLKRQLAEKEFELKEVIRRFNEVNNSLINQQAIVETLPELIEKCERLKEEFTLCEREYKVLSKTIEFFDTANEVFKSRYRKPLEDAVNKYMSIVLNTEYSKIKVDTSMHVNVEESGSQKSAGYYSKGYRNLFEICKRFALIDVLFTKEKPFIILDDPFYNLDDYKIKESLALVKELSKEYQILYFTCHDSRVIQ